MLLKNQSLGYKTGEGYLVAAGQSGKITPESGAFWDDNLTGATIYIKPRPNHIPTATDPEGWYVHTAYPDVAR